MGDEEQVSRVDLRVFPDLKSLSLAAAGRITEMIMETLQDGRRFSIALAGGQTPRALYECLASQFAGLVPWHRVDFFWGDERYVPHDDPRSNYRMARESLLRHIQAPNENIHPIPTHLPDPAEAARQYEATLPAQFDLILLGMGPDGHTASLFPHSPALDEQRRRVVDVQVSAEPPVRITFTMPLLVQAAAVHFLVAGKDKAAPLRKALSPETQVSEIPTARVFREARNVICWADEAAAR